MMRKINFLGHQCARTESLRLGKDFASSLLLTNAVKIKQRCYKDKIDYIQ